MKYFNLLLMSFFLISCNGAEGLNGNTGATGVTGPSGSNGIDGTNGTNGSSGSTGSQGSIGMAGASGASAVSVIEVRREVTNYGPSAGPTCPTGWAQADLAKEFYGGGYNMKATCYNEAQSCNVLYLRREVDFLANGMPPDCPTGWTDHWNSPVFVGTSGAYYRERLCYICR